MLLDTDRFLNELGKLYERNKASGTVRLTMKRSNLKPRTKNRGDRKVLAETEDRTLGDKYQCLIRATDGKKVISTTVASKDHMRFQAAYSVLLKAHMNALKKREREKKHRKGKGAVSMAK